jgi:hypothetical protein
MGLAFATGNPLAALGRWPCRANTVGTLNWPMFPINASLGWATSVSFLLAGLWRWWWRCWRRPSVRCTAS